MWSFQSQKPLGGPDYLFSFGENELSWKLHYLPCLMWANFSHTAISALKPFGNAQWSVSCSSVSAWHSFSQLSPGRSLCDNSRLGLVSLRQARYTRDNLMKVWSRDFKSTRVLSQYRSRVPLKLRWNNVAFFKGRYNHFHIFQGFSAHWNIAPNMHVSIRFFQYHLTNHEVSTNRKYTRLSPLYFNIFMSSHPSIFINRHSQTVGPNTYTHGWRATHCRQDKVRAAAELTRNRAL